MRRFFFDFREADDHYSDNVGSDFANVEEAYLEAFKAAQEMWGELLKQRRDPRQCCFEVRNAGGDALFMLPFQEVLDCCRIRRTVPLQRTFEELSATHNYAQRVSSEFVQQIRATHQALQQSRELLQQVGVHLSPSSAWVPVSTSSQTFTPLR